LKKKAFTNIVLNKGTREQFIVLKKTLSDLSRLNRGDITTLDHIQTESIELSSYALFARILVIQKQLKKSHRELKILFDAIMEKLKEFLPQPQKKYNTFFSTISRPSFSYPEKYSPTLKTINEEIVFCDTSMKNH
jgi:hypothetical protein